MYKLILPDESRELEDRLNVALDRMAANMRQGGRVVAIRSVYKDLKKADPDDPEEDNEEEKDDENA